MASGRTLRAVLGGSLALGLLDLAVIDLVLAPEVVASTTRSPATPVVAAAPLEVAPPAPVPDPFVAPEVPAAPEPPRAAAMPVPSAKPQVRDVPTPAKTAAEVYFATMSATLDNRARRVLADAAKRGDTFVLEGHADIRGDESYNAKLSRKRALAVRGYLLALGVRKDRIELRYTGEARADASDEELWRDRRVDIQITGVPR